MMPSTSEIDASARHECRNQDRLDSAFAGFAEGFRKQLRVFIARCRREVPNVSTALLRDMGRVQAGVMCEGAPRPLRPAARAACERVLWEELP